VADRYRRAVSGKFFDLFGEDSRRNLHARKLEVRPLGAPTTSPVRGLDSGRSTVRSDAPAVPEGELGRDTQLSKSRLAVVPGYSHYNFITSPIIFHRVQELREVLRLTRLA
jgi:hypothetical protein